MEVGEKMIEGTPVRSYKTDFPNDEDPVSENGMWVNGKKDGIDWSDVVTSNGVIHGGPSRMQNLEKRAEQGNLGDSDEEPVGDYDDPTAVLSGEWGPNQHGRGVAHIENPTEEWFQEVQIRLRTTIEPNSCTGYEVFFRCLKGESGYAEIVRWNGAIGDWTSLKRQTGPEFGVEHGDVIEATIEGNVITGFVNGVEKITVTDDTYASGAPGVGFNFGVGDTYADHGFSEFEADTYD
jgi:hypothetical protein